MKNIELLFEYNKNNNTKFCTKKIKLVTIGKFKKKFWQYKNTNPVFSGNDIYNLLCSLNYIIETDKFNFPILIQLDTVEFNDKLVFVILECICYYLVNIVKKQVYVILRPKKSIWTDGIRFSSMRLLNTKDYYNTFNSKFYYDLQLKHFRKIIEYSNFKTDYLNQFSSDVFMFLKHIYLDETTIDILCEAITEIVGNAIEHGHSDCLIDIDVTDATYQKQNDDEDFLYYGINVVVLNFSDKSFFHKLKHKLLTSDDLNERHQKVNQAKLFHSQHFNKEYTEDDFYTIAAFQHKISGSIQKKAAGGVGLTQLIKSIEEKSSGHICYMLSNNRILDFKKELLQYDEDDYIGFNFKNDFFRNIPELSIFKNSSTFFSGTAYNLNFAIKKGEIEDGE